MNETVDILKTSPWLIGAALLTVVIVAFFIVSTVEGMYKFKKRSELIHTLLEEGKDIKEISSLVEKL